VKNKKDKQLVEARNKLATRYAIKCWIVESINVNEDVTKELAQHAQEIQKE
jgi:hypothetical protein